jgi:hypothetical protein
MLQMQALSAIARLMPATLTLICAAIFGTGVAHAASNDEEA